MPCRAAIPSIRCRIRQLGDIVAQPVVAALQGRRLLDRAAQAGVELEVLDLHRRRSRRAARRAAGSRSGRGSRGPAASSPAARRRTRRLRAPARRGSAADARQPRQSRQPDIGRGSAGRGRATRRAPGARPCRSRRRPSSWRRRPPGRTRVGARGGSPRSGSTGDGQPSEPTTLAAANAWAPAWTSAVQLGAARAPAWTPGSRGRASDAGAPARRARARGGRDAADGAARDGRAGAAARDDARGAPPDRSDDGRPAGWLRASGRGGDVVERVLRAAGVTAVGVMLSSDLQLAGGAQVR